jgi:predicted DNA-binding transcriptional regulator AlpA
MSRPKLKTLDLGPRPLISVTKTAAKLGCHSATVMRRVAADKNFPQPIRVYGTRLAWFEDEVDAYVRSRPRAFA